MQIKLTTVVLLSVLLVVASAASIKKPLMNAQQKYQNFAGTVTIPYIDFCGIPQSQAKITIVAAYQAGQDCTSQI